MRYQLVFYLLMRGMAFVVFVKLAPLVHASWSAVSACGPNDSQ